MATRARKAIRADPSAIKDAIKRAMPLDLSPQLATLVKEVPRGPEWLHETKYDGYRILCFLRNGKAKLVSRTGNDWTARFRTIAEACEKLPITAAILDGELSAVLPNGRTSFQTLQNAIKDGTKARFAYFVFDLPYLEGYDLRHCALIDRKALLQDLFQGAGEIPGLHFSGHIEGHGEAVYRHACEHKLEGVISKRADSVYESRRAKSWLKIKCSSGQEFVIGGYSEPAGARRYFGALLLGYYDNGSLRYCGRVGTGFDEASLKSVYQALQSRKQKTPPFKDPPVGADARGVHWLRPELVAEVEFTEWTDEGILRHPSFKGLREDKKPELIIREEAGRDGQSRLASRPPRVKQMRSPTSKKNDVEIAGVRISNPGRVLYPEQGLTKQDLAQFYVDIAEWVLPHVVNRPLSIVRCPEGRSGQCFYQKHVTEGMPGAIRGIPIKEKDDTEDYLIIDGVAGLVSLVQIGALEIHPWGSRGDKVEKPDVLTFDLDPAEEVAWKDVVKGAVALREFLGDLGLESYLKTSGGKGLHLVVPIARRIGWDDAKAFARAVAETFSRNAPERYLATMSKAKRKGRIFVDYLRNGRGATSVAAYSTRAKPHAPVSTPIAWDELTTKLRPDTYRVSNLRKRLETLETDPWSGYFDNRQSITASMRKKLGV